jgi:hypothetical protein
MTSKSKTARKKSPSPAIATATETARSAGRFCLGVQDLEDGGARRNRTADLLHAMQALSQLSYGPVSNGLTVTGQIWERVAYTAPRR